jgi:galactokinase
LELGEHIDYCGFPVLPMAVERDILVAVKVVEGSSELHFGNTNTSFPKRVNQIISHSEGIVDIDPKIHEWSNYAKAGFKGTIEHFNVQAPKGMKCMFNGTIPTGSGISSSSALVCSMVIATATAHNADLDKSNLTQIAVNSERYVGINGGGMDQTASIMSQLDQALLIEFFPEFKTTPVKIPVVNPPASFVVANSLTVSDKHVTAPVCYNLRVVETRLAAFLMAKKYDLVAKIGDYPTLKMLMDGYFDKLQEITSSLKGSEAEIWIQKLDIMLQLVDETFAIHDGYTIEEIISLSAESYEAINERFLTKFPIRAEKFQLYTRAKHVFSEAKRVIEFRDVCEKSNAGTGLQGDELLTKLGKLMTESQESCKNNFNCSCPELDELTSICIEAGATGSRLTGAGWGGCTVSLVPGDKVDSFIQTVKTKYYKGEDNPRNTKGEAFPIDEVLFSTQPGQGAVIYQGSFDF